MFRKLDMFPSSGKGRIKPNLSHLAFSKGANRVGFPSPYLKTETYPVFETLCFLGYLEFRTMDRVHTLIDSVIHHRQNPFDSTHKTMLCRKIQEIDKYSVLNKCEDIKMPPIHGVEWSCVPSYRLVVCVQFVSQNAFLSCTHSVRQLFLLL
jgi:hypothetical protein